MRLHFALLLLAVFCFGVGVGLLSWLGLAFIAASIPAAVFSLLHDDGKEPTA